jgi:hypothetical protein
MGSGCDAEIQYSTVKESFMQKYPKFGNPDTFRLCIDYLHDKPKFVHYRLSNKKNELEKKERPTGQKKAKQQDKDKKLVERVLGKVSTVAAAAPPPPVVPEGQQIFLGKLGAAIESFSAAYTEKMSREEDNELLEVLTAEERVEFLRERALTRMMEMRLKRQRLEATITNLPNPQANLQVPDNNNNVITQTQDNGNDNSIDNATLQASNSNDADDFFATAGLDHAFSNESNVHDTNDNESLQGSKHD